MRALALLAFTIAACVAHAQQTRDAPFRNILSSFGIKDLKNIITCIQKLGPTKCLTALSSWRAKTALESLDRGSLTNNTNTEQFPWEKYSNASNEEIYSQLSEGTEKLLHYKTLAFTMIPGYRLELKSKENGKLNVDVFKNDVTSARGSKLKKQFYKIVPYLLIPGLIMSAVLPFVLPAMKLATVASIMLNNMALTGAIFTLLRDNAFNDYARPKVKYINAGWKNEEELYREHEHAYIDHEDHYSGGNIEEIHHNVESETGEDFAQFEHIKLPNNFRLNGNKDFVELNIKYDPHNSRISHRKRGNI